MSSPQCASKRSCSTTAITSISLVPISGCARTMPLPQLLSLVKAGPALCFEPKAKCDVEIALDGFIECDTHRFVGEPSGDRTWSYQYHGYGVLFELK